MEIPLENHDSSSSANVEYHKAFTDRWKETDASMCRHSMSFHLHHAIRSDFFASYLYLLDKTPMACKLQRKLIGRGLASGSRNTRRELLSLWHQDAVSLYHQLDTSASNSSTSSSIMSQA
ncbi:unnamed protein product [Pleuronectes platessa]|uniref:Uncharacterized protein n=1 Tax=Pleuronectes platessa TaxID=8262 RepID=A0A9N7YHB2_PLEPL|nr:unnamed protein product [Pleuronectes platessa]